MALSQDDLGYIYSGAVLDGPEVKTTFRFLGVIRYLRLIDTEAYLASTMRNKVVKLVINMCLYPDKE